MKSTQLVSWHLTWTYSAQRSMEPTNRQTSSTFQPVTIASASGEQPEQDEPHLFPLCGFDFFGRPTSAAAEERSSGLLGRFVGIPAKICWAETERPLVGAVVLEEGLLAVAAAERTIDSSV